jgi:leucyl-tRNA synthetase
MFPYPSGKLHMGHVQELYHRRCALARFHGMLGFNVHATDGLGCFRHARRERGAGQNNVPPAGNGPTPTSITCGPNSSRLGFAIDWQREIRYLHARVLPLGTVAVHPPL